MEPIDGQNARKEPVNGLALIVAAIGFCCLFWLIVIAQSGVRGGQNFATEAWELKRFFELWWLWLSLPGCAASAALAAMRSDGFLRLTASVIVLLTFTFCLCLSYGFYKQW
ncbi:MAG: hypothetical protein AAGH88_12200 [Planctomycetota bacterium]